MTLAVAISTEAERRLSEKATAIGVDLPTYVSRLLESEAHRPTLLELSGDTFDNFKRLKLKEEELSQRLEDEKHAARAAERGHPFAE